MKKVFAMLAAALILVSFAACSFPSGEKDFFAGDPVSPDELRRYSEEFSDGTDTAEIPTTLPKRLTVFWVPGGSVYHRYLDCEYIASVKDPEVGSVGAAEKAGIPRLCRTCAKKYAEEATES